MDAGIHTAKLNACAGCRQIVVSIGCSINFDIQSVSSSCNYCDKVKILQTYIQPNSIQVVDAEKVLSVLDAA